MWAMNIDVPTDDQQAIVCEAPELCVGDSGEQHFYTLDFEYNTSSCHLQKFSDDSSIARCNGDESEYRGMVEDFVFWRRENKL